MKGGYVAVVAFAAVVVMVFAEDHPITPIPKECPLVDPIDRTVHLKHENDCTKYYACFRGQPIEMSCPLRNNKGQKLHFNALLQVCDWPSKAGCIGTTKPVDVDPTSPPPTWEPGWVCKDLKDGTMIPHETRCYLFYRCANHQPTLESCPEGLHFDPYKQTCLEPRQSECPIKNACRDHKGNKDKFYPVPGSCKEVYYCRGTKTTRYTCDEGAEWSVTAEKCMIKEKANCVPRFDY